MRKKLNKGITLVGLVITIIILLILAGITISTLSGENGLIAKVQEARKAQIGAEIIEKLTLAIQELVIEKNGEATLYDITQEWIDSKLPEYENTVKVDNETNEIIITIKKDDVTKTFIIDENFNITEITTQSSIEISYDIVERTGKTVKILIHIQDKVNGLNRIELPDTDTIIVEANKKQEKAIDYQVEIDVEYKIIVTSDNGETKEYIILISDFASGNGTEENPYIIMTEEQLRKVKNDLNAHYKLGANIEITSDFEAIGINDTPFNGSLDGDGYKIIGLKNTGTTLQYQGLFGYIGTSGKVSDLTLENVEIKGRTNTGGLVGLNQGTIQNVKISGTVTVTSSSVSNIGGLVGYNNQGTIENCYSSVDVGEDSTSDTNITCVGGLVGSNQGTINKVASSGKVTMMNISSSIGGLVGSNGRAISNAYSTGEVDIGTYGSEVGGLIGYNSGGTITNTYTISKVNGNQYVGGLVGYKYDGTITNSYWTTEKSGITTSAGGISTTVTWLTTKSNLNDKFDFEEIWGIEDGRSLPYLNGMPIPEAIYVMDQGYVTFEGGNGTIDNPYIIKTEEQLNKIRYDLNAHYKLGANIEITSEFEAIGTKDTPFNGIFDGDGYKIINLKNVGTTAQYQGLFGYINSSGKVINLTLENVDIKGASNTGGLVGYNKGIIQNVKISGKVTVTASNVNYIGGLVGHNNPGTIENCYSSVDVGLASTYTNISYVGGLIGRNNSGTINKVATSGNVTINTSSINRIGGLVGQNNTGTISNAYTTGEVNTGTVGTYVGGLVGQNTNGTVTNTYTISRVLGSTSNVGGLIGYLNGGTVTNSYWTTEKSGITTSAGGTELTLEQMQTQSSYEGWDFESGTMWIMKTYPELIF